MQPGPDLPAGFDKVRLVGRLVPWALLFAGALFAGPDLYARFFEDRDVDIAQAVVIAVVCLGLSGVAGAAARSIARAQALRRAEYMAEAGVGEAFVVASRDPGSADFYRVATAEKPTPLPPLNRLADTVVEQHGGDGLVIGVTIFCWLFFSFLALTFDGTFHGTGPGPGGIVAVVVLTLVAVTVASLSHRTVLSNRDRAAYTELRCLGWRRRESRPLADFDAVVVYHEVGHARSPTSRNVSSTRRYDRFAVALAGAAEMPLLASRSPFRARRRAQQIAAYLQLPLAEPEVDDSDKVRLFQG